MRKNKSAIVYIILLGVMIIAIIAAAAVLLVTGKREHEEQISELNRLNDQLESEGSQMELTIGGLESQKARLESELAALKDQLAALEGELAISKMNQSDAITKLQGDIAAKNAEISALEKDLERYKVVFNIDVRAQAQLIDEIIAYIETMCPYVRMVDTINEETEEIETYKWVAVADLIEEERVKAAEAEEEFILSEEALEELDEEQLLEYQAMLTKTLRPRVLAREDVFYPSISVYYEDLTTGYHFDYEGSVVYDSASVIKAPYIMSFLEVISADEKRYLEELAEKNELPEKIDTDGDDVGDTIKIVYSDPIYDLSETVVYNKETMFEEGSGKIKDMEDGIEFSYLDFIKYTLEYSDNVAYQALRSRFGFQLMYNLASRVGARSVVQNGRNMTAADAGKLFKAIWEFIEEDETYGPIMEESMKKANHTVIIPYGVYPTKSLHKYGWDTDAYHDAAIVLHSGSPYVLAVFSDLDNGGVEIDAFLREIVKMIHKLHSGFYR